MFMCMGKCQSIIWTNKHLHLLCVLIRQGHSTRCRQKSRPSLSDVVYMPHRWSSLRSKKASVWWSRYTARSRLINLLSLLFLCVRCHVNIKHKKSHWIILFSICAVQVEYRTMWYTALHVTIRLAMHDGDSRCIIIVNERGKNTWYVWWLVNTSWNALRFRDCAAIQVIFAPWRTTCSLCWSRRFKWLAIINIKGDCNVNNRLDCTCRRFERRVGFEGDADRERLDIFQIMSGKPLPLLCTGHLNPLNNI